MAQVQGWDLGTFGPTAMEEPQPEEAALRPAGRYPTFMRKGSFATTVFL